MLNLAQLIFFSKYYIEDQNPASLWYPGTLC